VAWLPHYPMLAFDILPSYGGGIGILPWFLLSSCAAPPSFWATEDDPSYTISFLIFFISVQEILPLTNLSPFNK
jgi:hypothetical protein